MDIKVTCAEHGTSKIYWSDGDVAWICRIGCVILTGPRKSVDRLLKKLSPR